MQPKKKFCVSKLCLNTKLLFHVIKAEMKEENSLISQFFMSNCTCPKSSNGFFELNCCNGKCKNCSQELPTLLNSEKEGRKSKSYYQFQRVNKQYTSKHDAKEKKSCGTETSTQ